MGGLAGASGSRPVAKKRHMIEVARIGKGDIINGITLFGKAPVFFVVAASQVSEAAGQYCAALQVWTHSVFSSCDGRLSRAW